MSDLSSVRARIVEEALQETTHFMHVSYLEHLREALRTAPPGKTISQVLDEKVGRDEYDPIKNAALNPVLVLMRTISRDRLPLTEFAELPPDDDDMEKWKNAWDETY